MRAVSVSRSVIAGLCVLLLLSACGLGDSKEAAPTAAPTVSSGSGSEPTSAPSDAGGTMTISDAICAADVPDDWVETGVAQGRTPSGARFRIFGNRLADDAAWDAAVALVKADAEKRNVEAEVSADSVRVTYPGQTGFQFRVRQDDRYCDVTVTSPAAIPDGERAAWPGIEASLRPAS